MDPNFALIRLAACFTRLLVLAYCKTRLEDLNEENFGPQNLSPNLTHLSGQQLGRSRLASVESRLIIRKTDTSWNNGNDDRINFRRVTSDRRLQTLSSTAVGHVYLTCTPVIYLLSCYVILAINTVTYNRTKRIKANWIRLGTPEKSKQMQNAPKRLINITTLPQFSG